MGHKTDRKRRKAKPIRKPSRRTSKPAPVERPSFVVRLGQETAILTVSDDGRVKLSIAEIPGGALVTIEPSEAAELSIAMGNASRVAGVLRIQLQEHADEEARATAADAAKLRAAERKR